MHSVSEMLAPSSSRELPPSAPAGGSPPAGSDESGIEFPDELEKVMGGYQWRFLWLGVARSDSSIFAPAGEQNILGHHGIVAWSQPHGDEADPL